MTTSTSHPRVPFSPPPALIIAVLCFGSLCGALMQSLVIPIQSELPSLLGTNPSNASWVVTVTLLAGAIAMPVSGRLADMYGKKRVIVVSAAILLLGSIVTAASSTLGPVLVGRALQGVAMGYIPVAISLVRELAPPQLRAGAVAAVSATLGVGGALGLPLAAWIAQSRSWHDLFWLSAGLAAIVIVVSWLLVPDHDQRAPGRLDGVGILGLALGLVALLIGISKGSAWGWGSVTTWACIGAGVVVLLAWGAYELRQDAPLVDLRTTARPAVLFTNLAAVLIGFGMPTLVLDNVPRSESGSSVGVNSLMRSLGTTTAGAVMAALLTSQTQVLTPGDTPIPTAGAFQLCFAVGALAALIGAAITLLVPRDRPMRTVPRGERSGAVPHAESLAS